MIEKSCMNYDGDEDCNKCCKNGYIFDCPTDCPDYVDFFGKKKEGKDDKCNTKRK